MKNGRKHTGGKKKRTLFFGITSRFLMLIAAGLLLLSNVSHFINPAKAWLMTVFGLMYVPLLALNLALFVWAVFRKSKASIIPLIALMPSLFIVGRYVRLSSPDTDAQDADAVKIVSYNVGQFGLFGKDSSVKNSSECADSILSAIAAMDPDIVCFQEFHVSGSKTVKKMVSKYFKGYNVDYHLRTGGGNGTGNVTLSRYKTLDKGKITFENSSNLALYTDYDIKGKRFRVYNCHFQSYNFSLARLMMSMRSDYRAALKDSEDRIKASIALRPKQVDKVMRSIAEGPVNAIVTGDFNDNPISYTYNRLSRGRRDSFKDAGRGFGASHSFLWPFLRIDYVLYPKDCRAVSHDVVRLPYSDHYPVVAQVALSKQ